jgi:hypothetical protein
VTIKMARLKAKEVKNEGIGIENQKAMGNRQ